MYNPFNIEVQARNHVCEGFVILWCWKHLKDRTGIFSRECVYTRTYTVFSGCTHIIHLAACQWYMGIIRS